MTIFTINTSIATSSANSYITSASATAYLQQRPGFSSNIWTGDNSVAFSLVTAGIILDTMSFKGIKATENQSMAFPRITKDMQGYDSGSFAEPPYSAWSDLVTDYNAASVALPTIPIYVKYAQTEIAYQAVYNQLITLDPMEEGDSSIRDVTIGNKIKIGVDSSSNTTIKNMSFFNKAFFDSTRIIQFYLKKWLIAARGFLI
jgi:hypothetical protein